MFFTLGLEGFWGIYVGYHLSDVAQGRWDRPNSNLTPGWMTGDNSWKETPSLSVLLQATCVPAIENMEPERV